MDFYILSLFYLWLRGKVTRYSIIAVRTSTKQIWKMWVTNVMLWRTVNIRHPVSLFVKCWSVCSGVTSLQKGVKVDWCALPVSAWLLSSFLLRSKNPHIRMIGSFDLFWVFDLLWPRDQWATCPECNLGFTLRLFLKAPAALGNWMDGCSLKIETYLMMHHQRVGQRELLLFLA